MLRNKNHHKAKPCLWFERKRAEAEVLLRCVKNIIWKSILVGQMVRLFWVIGTVREFDG